MAETRPDIKLPAGYTDEAEFLRDMRTTIAGDQAFDRYNREAGVEDLEFLTGEQWDSDLRERRERRRRPTLTINRIPAFVAQVVGSRLQNETQVRVRPESEGDKAIAEVREGLIRAIQRNSNAQAAFDNSLFGAVACGIGNFRISVNYENDEVWHHSVRVDTIPDHFAVVWDRKMSDPTGADAAHCVILERMAEDTFETRYPWATPSDVTSAAMPAELQGSEWYSDGDVQIANYWTMREHKRRIALLISGATVDITAMDADANPEDADIIQSIMVGRDGEPMVREVYRKYAQLYRCSGADVLEGPYDLPIDRVPVFRVPGWEVKIGEQVRRWGIIRNMKDPQRLQNYWRPLSLDTPLPTPTGWTTMGAVKVGDKLFDEKGKPCNVIGTSPTHINRKCFRVSFNDGTSIVADAEHPWAVEERGRRNSPNTGWNWVSKVVHTDELVPDKHFIWCTAPLDAPEADLPVHPYFLGSWLGNGGSKSGRMFYHKDDVEEARGSMMDFGMRVSDVRPSKENCHDFTVYDMLPKLRELGVVSSKHIPAAYLRGSRQQREWLLQGLMDTDGTIPKHGCCSFTTVTFGIAEGFSELLNSLGIRFGITVRSGRTYGIANGGVGIARDAYQFSFTAATHDTVFRFARKLARQKRKRNQHLRRGKRFGITSVEAVPSVPVKCVGVDAPSHLFLAGESMIPTHNSSVAEKLMQTPRATWVAPDTAVSGREQSWRDSATSDDPLLIWNAESGQPPQRMPPATLENALITEAQITTQDMKDVSNIHEANLGMPSNEVSGVAIRERVAVSDTGTALYNHNLSRSITECGRVINELIPTVYDTERVVSILGDDDTEREAILNVQNSPDAIDITSGKYTVIASVGASYKTKRQENREAMLALAQSLPQMFSLAGDLLVESMDWPMADKIAARLRKTLPPQLLSPDEITPEIAKAAQAKGQEQQQAMQAEVRKQMADFMKAQSQAAENFAHAQHYRDSDEIAALKAKADVVSEASKIADRELRGHLEAIKTATGGG